VRDPGLQAVGRGPEQHTAETYNGQTGGGDDLGQLERNVGQHVVVLRKLGVGRVEVEAGADAKVPVGVLAFYAGAAGRGVWEK
jgi:hypothetical protein